MSNTFNAVHHRESVKSEAAVLLFIVDLLTAAKFTRAYNMYNKETICKG
jgi:hypothetical protein